MNVVKKIFATLALILFTSTTCAASDLIFEPLAAVGYRDSDKQILMLIRTKDNGELFFMPFDAETESGAFIKFDRKIYDFYLNRGEHNLYSPLMFVMATTRQSDPVDDKLGIWQGDTHLIPVYAIFDVRDGQIIFDAPYFYSGEETITPSHYHSNIQNPIHTRLIKTLMTKMPLLHAEIEAKGIALP